MNTIAKRISAYILAIALVLGLFSITGVEADAETYMIQVVTLEPCSLWSQPNTSAPNKVKVLPAGYLVKVYPNYVLSTKDDGKIYYRTSKGNYILTRCVQTVPKTRLTDGFVVNSSNMATYQALRQQQEQLELQEMVTPYISNPAAQEAALEKKYGVNIVIPSAYMKTPTSYAMYVSYMTEALSMISPEWVSMVAQVSKQQTGKKLTISIKEYEGIHLGGTQAEGVYNPSSNSISLASIDSFTLSHEIGHAFYYYCKAKTPNFSAKWTSYNNGISYVGNNYYNVNFTYAMEACFFSDYSMKDANEDFAETCAYMFYGYTEELVNGTAANKPYLAKKVEYIRKLSNQYAGKRII